MTWYMAVLVRGSFLEGTLDEERLGDKLFQLVEAPDAETAYRRASELGEAAKEDYADDDGNTVTLRFLGLADLKEISSPRLGDGIEVYSALIDKNPSESAVSRERLTVFETDAELSAAEDGDGSNEGPIRPG